MCHYETQGVILTFQNGTGMALIVTPGGDDKCHSCAILKCKDHPLRFIMAHSGTPTLSLEETGGILRMKTSPRVLFTRLLQKFLQKSLQKLLQRLLQKLLQ